MEFDRNDMEDSRKEALLDLENSLSELKSRLEAIERKIDEYKSLLKPTQQDDAEMIDLGNEDFLGDISVVAPDPVPASVSVPVSAEDDIPASNNESENMTVPTFDETGAYEEEAAGPAADDSPVSDAEVTSADLPEGADEESLFGEVFEAPAEAPMKPAEKESEKKRQTRNLNEQNASKAGKAVMDIKADRPAWLSDMTGPAVKDVRSAISLNDRVMFITSLFRKDSMLFQDTVTKINGMASLDKVIEYVNETFPEWNMNSEHVYRFMMAVRRKIHH